MKTYKNISEEWGDHVTVTAEDYREQARAFFRDCPQDWEDSGKTPDDLVIEEREDGIYIDGEQVAAVE